MQNERFFEELHVLDEMPDFPRLSGRMVSSNTVLRRLNLALKQRGEVIRKCREDNRYHDVLGAYYLEDAKTRRIIMPHVNLKAYAKRFQVLADCEVFTG